MTLCVILSASRTEALTKTELRCQRMIASSARGFARDILAARQNCVLRVLKGQASPVLDCLSGTGDAATMSDLGKAEAVLAQKIPSRCGGVDLTQLGFPGTCEDKTGAPFSVLDLEDCIITMMGDQAADLLQFEYPLTIDHSDSRQQRRCVDKVGRRGKRLIVREMRARQNCLDREQQFEFDGSLNCRDPLPPEAAGTGDDRFDRPILRARVRLLSGIPENCRTVNIDALGYDDDCPDFTGAPFNIVDMQTCQRDAHVSSIRSMLELSYPSPPECGNGIREDLEECDDGNANQNDRCLNDCTLAGCGDGVPCTAASCTTGPGGGPEACDDGNTSNNDACLGNCSLPSCGDGFVCSAAGCTTGPGGGREDCDDANSSNNDACLNTCAAATCGDGFVEFGKEDCDDANTNNNDSCMNSCIFADCGDGVTCTASDCISGPNGGPEQCDDGNAVDTDFCKSDCSLFTCGDGLVFPDAEECDDGNTQDGDGCSSTCTVEGVCGDGNAGIGEDCDGADDAACPGACRTDCTCPGCGDGVVDAGEECDDGNTVDTDACSNACKLAVCGDGVVNGTDQCDDGNANDADACRNDCTLAICGDGVLCTAASCTSGPGGGVEVCDDGNTAAGDGCDSKCARETVCGDGFVDGAETCDPGGIGGASANDAACPGACRPSDCQCPACGDGVVDAGETCDDGNTVDTDGCRGDCSAAAACGDGVVCSDAASCTTGPGAGVEECDDANATDTDGCRNDCSTAVCGDGVLCSDAATCTSGPGAGIEECDDGNVTPGDGCDATCMKELVAGEGCPASGRLQLFAGVGKPCATNADCKPVGASTCDTSIGKCRTGSELDTGWTGVSHDSDTIEDVFLSGRISCPGQGGSCGVCDVQGIAPDAGNCRCADDVSKVCDQPFQADNDDCGGAQCECFLGPPLALGVPGAVVCVVNKFAEDVTGTAEVDSGNGELTANIRSIVHTGTSLFTPCPVCGGTCVAPTESRCVKPFSVEGQICTVNSDCDVAGGDGACKGRLGDSCFEDRDCDISPGDGLGVCSNFDTAPRDGIREGTCFGGERDGLACDVDALNTTFPALPSVNGAPGSNGGATSYDCPPAAGNNISGAGLRIGLVTTTGRTEMTRHVDCGFPVSFPPFVQVDCFCRACSGGPASQPIPCNSDEECAALGAGTCSINGNTPAKSPGFNECSKEVADGGDGFGTGACVAADADGIEGKCMSATDDRVFCDGVLRGDGTPLQPCDPRPLCLDTLTGCTTNADCNTGIECSPDAGCSASVVGRDLGSCSIVERKPCFLDPIIAQGIADPKAPMGAANFCIPPTLNQAINAVGGLPGPGRVRIQTESTLFCASDPNVVYTPGVGGCP